MQGLARVQGIVSVSELAFRMHRSRQALYPIWRGTAKQISLDMLAQLAHTLNADPGDWFRWSKERWEILERPPGSIIYPRLCWNIETRASALGLDATKLSFNAQVHMRSIRPIWQGIAQAVSVSTLTRLAIALDTFQIPFVVGHLLT